MSRAVTLTTNAINATIPAGPDTLFSMEYMDCFTKQPVPIARTLNNVQQNHGAPGETNASSDDIAAFMEEGVKKLPGHVHSLLIGEEANDACKTSIGAECPFIPAGTRLKPLKGIETDTKGRCLMLLEMTDLPSRAWQSRNPHKAVAVLVAPELLTHCHMVDNEKNVYPRGMFLRSSSKGCHGWFEIHAGVFTGKRWSHTNLRGCWYDTENTTQRDCRHFVEGVLSVEQLDKNFDIMVYPEDLELHVNRIIARQTEENSSGPKWCPQTVTLHVLQKISEEWQHEWQQKCNLADAAMHQLILEEEEGGKQKKKKKNKKNKNQRKPPTIADTGKEESAHSPLFVDTPLAIRASSLSAFSEDSISPSPVSVVSTDNTEDSLGWQGGEPAMCIVCTESASTHAMVPCGHQCICVDCVKRKTEWKYCPYCNSETAYPPIRIRVCGW